MRGCSKLTNIDVTKFNTNNVTSIQAMFSGCSNLTSLDVKGFNTINVTNMNDLFYSCSSLTNLDISNFNTQSVTSMIWMFGRCKKLTGLNLGRDFIINENTTYDTEMFSQNPSNIKIKALEETKDKIIQKYPNLESNFEIIE